MNTTLVEGYPSCGSEAGGLSKDVFLRPAKSQSKWYWLFSDHKVDPSAVSSWCTDATKLNSSYSGIAKHSGLTSTPPASRRISQETLRRWERSAREATVICNQASSFNRCLFKVQLNMQDQLKTLRSESKGKASHKSSSAADELQYLMDFNASITQAAAKTMEHLTDFVFISMGNITLASRDVYLSHLRTGIKPDKLNALTTGLLYINTLFPDSALRKAEEDMVSFESKGHSRAGRSKGRYHRIRGLTAEAKLNRTGQLGRTSIGDSSRKGKVVLPTTHLDQPRASSRINDILLPYNSLPCGTQCCTRMATRHHGQRLRKKDIYGWP